MKQKHYISDYFLAWRYGLFWAFSSNIAVESLYGSDLYIHLQNCFVFDERDVKFPFADLEEFNNTKLYTKIVGSPKQKTEINILEKSFAGFTNLENTTNCLIRTRTNSYDGWANLSMVSIVDDELISPCWEICFSLTTSHLDQIKQRLKNRESLLITYANHPKILYSLD